ncbi:MAG: hypothetical protein ACXAAM_01260 [Candidatus Heimdallarchaeaceae archaeon]|jgi:wobble nucleotide-excising tRNase
MYETKVPGTRYTVELINVKGQWMIQIKLVDVVEASVVVKDISERGIRENIKSVVSEVNLYINDFMLDQITKKITEQAQILFKEVVATASRESHEEMTAVEETIIQMVKRIEALEQRIQRLESLLSGGESPSP